MRIRSLRAWMGTLSATTRLILAGLVLLTAMACNNSSDTPSTTATETIPPLFETCAATPAAITVGQSCKLYWTITSAKNASGTVSLPTTVSIDQGIGAVALSGSVIVSPAATTTYVVTATYPSGTIPGSTTTYVGGVTTTSVTITVVPAVDGALSLYAGMPQGLGNLDGPAAGASFGYPSDVTADGSGNVFIADTLNNTIRKLSAAGQVSTFAGMPGQSGYGDGTGIAVTFSNPSSVAVDAAGSVFVADTGNNIIRKITSAGVVSTIAGKAGVLAGSTNGKGAAARFDAPYGLAVDGAGNVYVADSFNYTIRKLTPTPNTSGGIDYVVSTLAGAPHQKGSADGGATAARFNLPTGVAADGSGNVYVADYGNHVIRKITPDGTVSTLAGTAGASGTVDGAGAAARFNDPNKLSVDAGGNVYVADMGNHRIRMITPAGAVTTLAGSTSGYADGTGSNARFDAPIGVTVDGSGNVFVADKDNMLIRKIGAGAVVSTVAGSASHAGNIDATGSEARFQTPGPGALVSNAGGTLFLADSGNNSIRKIAPGGIVTTLVGSGGGLLKPEGIALDGLGNLIVADSGTHTIRMITPAGVVSTLAGSIGVSGTADGASNVARFNGPTGVALDTAGNVYVADYGNHAIRKITPAGVVSTLAGAVGVPGNVNGTGTAAHFLHPHGLAVDAAGNVYVADMENHMIRQITPAGVVTTLAGAAPGTEKPSGFVDDLNSSARFKLPSSVALDASGNLYVADQGNNAIRKVTTEATTGHVTTIAGLAGRNLTANGPLPGSIATPSCVAVDPSTGSLYAGVPGAVMLVTFN